MMNGWDKVFVGEEKSDSDVWYNVLLWIKIHF